MTSDALSSSPIIDFTGYRHNETTAPSVISLLWIGSRRVVGVVSLGSGRGRLKRRYHDVIVG